MGKVYTRFQTKTGKTPPDGAAHTHIARIREYSPPGVYVIVPHTERGCPAMKTAFVQGTNVIERIR